MKTRQSFIAIALLLMCFGCSNAELQRLQAEVDDLESQIDVLKDDVETANRLTEHLRDALRNANSQIEQAGDDISNAQQNAFGDCETLSIIVQGMEEPQTIQEP